MILEIIISLFKTNLYDTMLNYYSQVDSWLHSPEKYNESITSDHLIKIILASVSLNFLAVFNGFYIINGRSLSLPLQVYFKYM